MGGRRAARTEERALLGATSLEGQHVGVQSRGSYRVVVLSADRPDDVDTLIAEIGAQAARTGGTRARLDLTSDPSVLDAPPRPDDPTTLLVVLGGPVARHDAVMARAAARCRETLRACLPVFDPREPFEQQLPEEVHRLNGVPWARRRSAADVASHALRLVGLTESERRVFLSYRRTDGTAIAHQLRHALLDGGWDVFLDRFSVPPAAAFQVRLERDLADKAFVLLLETPDATGSSWVEREVAFAHSRSLGLMSVALPETTEEQQYSSVLPQLRHRLTGGDVRGAVGRRTLSTRGLEGVLREVDERHAEAYQQRRENLLRDARREMRRSGCAITPIGQWALLGTRAHRDDVVLATARAPEPADLLAADRLRVAMGRTGRDLRAWVVHPLEDIDEERARLIGWLSRRRRVKPSPLMLLGTRLAR